MDSIIAPLTKKVELFNKDIARVVAGLAKGDPAAVERVHDLTSGVGKLYQDCKSAYSQVNAASQTALKTSMIRSPIQPDGIIVAPSFSYYFSEFMAAIQLVIAVIKLVTNMVSISTLLQALMSDLTQAYGYLNTQAIWLNKAVARAKQKTSKNIEWQRRRLAAQANILYLTSQQKQYQDVLKQLEAKQQPKPEPQQGINGEYINGTFVYFDKPTNPKLIQAIADNTTTGTTNTTMSNNAQNTNINTLSASTIDSNVTDSQISNVNVRLEEITVQLDKEKLELSSGIPNDETYWKTKWDKEEAADKELIKEMKTRFAGGLS